MAELIRQVVVRRRGGPEVLAIRDVPVPTVGSGQVRIRVATAGVIFADVLMREGLYPDIPPLPFVPGWKWPARSTPSARESRPCARGNGSRRIAASADMPSRPVIGQILALEDAATAHRLVGAAEVAGKIVLRTSHGSAP